MCFRHMEVNYLPSEYLHTKPADVLFIGSNYGQ